MSYEVIAFLGEGPGPSAAVTVIDLRGSGPRHLGARMAVRPGGVTTGTIGGGAVELEALGAAKRCLEEKASSTIDVAMLGEAATGDAPICGGSVRLLIEYVENPAGYREAAEALSRGTAVILCLDLPSPGESLRGSLLRGVVSVEGAVPAGHESAEALVPPETARAGLVREEGRIWAPVQPPDRLLILGGGHVGLALARFAAELDFRVRVGDHRPEFAAEDRFPRGVEAAQGSYPDLVRDFPPGDSAYVVIVTSGHQFDLESARAVLGKGYRYAGFIGSRRKTRMILDRLTEEGYDRREVESLRAPIGADIGAETPAEIAVSILAEIIAARRGSPALAAMDADRRRRRA